MAINKEITFLRQLQELKAVTVRMGILHEAQMLQLRNYPLLIPGVSKATASIDVDHKIVTYECIVKRKWRCTKKVLGMCKQISVWLKTILWDETAMVVLVNKEVIFDSRTNLKE